MDHHSQGNHSRFFLGFWRQCLQRHTFLPIYLQNKPCCPYYKASIAPNPKLLNNFEPSKEQLDKSYGGIMEEVNELRLQIASKKTFLPLMIKAKLSILILSKFKPKMLFFGFLIIFWISWLDNYIFLFARLWFCEDIHHSSILKLAIKKAIQKSTNANLSSKLFQDDSNYEKN